MNYPKLRKGTAPHWRDLTVPLEGDVVLPGSPRVLDLGDDRVVAVQHANGRARASGVQTDIRYAVVYTREGKILRGREYIDRSEALEAAGLRA